MRKTLVTLFAALMIVSMLAACAPAATPTAQVVIQTQVVKETSVVVQVQTQQVMATQIVQITNTPAPDRTQVFWYIGLGAGSQPDQIPIEKAFVDKYNKSQTEIQLVPIIVDNKYAKDNLLTQIAAGNAPDIVGPVGTAGRMLLPGAYLDLQPLVTQFNYDLSDVDPAFLQFFKQEGKLVGLPFASYPEFIYFNRKLFDEAKLAYPPQKVGDKYTFDGKQYDWTFDTMAMVAKRLTVDKNGVSSDQAGFDKNNIVQYGWVPQWTDNARAVATLFGAYYPFDSSGKAQFPPSAVAAIKYYYDAMWGAQPFAPGAAAINGDLMKGNAFSSGHVAMGTTHMWYTCCIDAKTVPSWDAAIMPSYNGKITAKLHGDTFAIMAATKNPTAAFKVYTYMLGAGAPDLYTLYGAFPARKGNQAAYIDSLNKKFAPNKVNWQPALDMIQYMDVPNHEYVATPDGVTPTGASYNKIYNTDLLAMTAKLQAGPGVDIDKLIADYTTLLTADWATK